MRAEAEAEAEALLQRGRAILHVHDFETGVTLVSLFLVPFAVWWIFSLESQLSRIPAREAARGGGGDVGGAS